MILQLYLKHALSDLFRGLHGDAGSVGILGEEDGEFAGGQGDAVHRAPVEPDVSLRPGLHLLGHVLQGATPIFSRPSSTTWMSA